MARRNARHPAMNENFSWTGLRTTNPVGYRQTFSSNKQAGNVKPGNDECGHRRRDTRPRKPPQRRSPSRYGIDPGRRTGRPEACCTAATPAWSRSRRPTTSSSSSTSRSSRTRTASGSTLAASRCAPWRSSSATPRRGCATCCATNCASLPDTGPRQDLCSSTLDGEKLWRWSEFHEAVARLPDELRAVFDLLWYQGLRQAETAELLRVSVPTVKLRWMKARLQV